MDHSDREYVSAAINFFWGDGTASPESVNERSAEVVYTAVTESQSCSASMDLVPRPSGGKPGIYYIRLLYHSDAAAEPSSVALGCPLNT